MLTDRDVEGAARCCELVRRAVLTHDALPPVRGPRLSQMRWETRDEFHEAYGYHPEAPRRNFRPTPRDVSNMLTVLGWLMCLRRDTTRGGPRDFKLLTSRARNVGWGKLAARFGKCERTVQRWHDAAVAQLYSRHATEVWEMTK